MLSREDRIKQWAHDLGFELAGIAAASPADGFDRLRRWLDQGCAGEMSYLHRHAEARRHPASILPEVRSVLMVGMSYKPAGSRQQAAGSQDQEGGSLSGSHALRGNPLPDALRPERAEPGGSAQASRDAERPGNGSHAERGDQEVGDQEGGSLPSARVACYAQGDDYHDVLRRRLNRLLERVQEEVPGCRGRGVVDTAPLLERDFARRAGLGWFGKNTMLLNKRLGSYLFLGALLLDLELQPDPAHQASHCGSCTACLDACPTQAFLGPGWLDARRCISYLTIELKGSVPADLRGQLGDWLFGCDICQEVCPWNRKAPASTEPTFQPRPDLDPADPVELLGLSEDEFRRRFRGTALMRSKRHGLLRNAALVLGNQGSPAVLPALQRALADPEPLVREAAQWAIERIRARYPG